METVSKFREKDHSKHLIIEEHDISNNIFSPQMIALLNQNCFEDRFTSTIDILGVLTIKNILSFLKIMSIVCKNLDHLMLTFDSGKDSLSYF